MRNTENIRQRRPLLSTESEVELLIARAAAGDAAARQDILALYETQLKRMVRVHLDRRVAARVDASDVVQDVFIKAWDKFSEYFRERPVALYPWLRRLAWDRVIELHRAHIRAQRRSVLRERRRARALPDQTATALVNQLATSMTSVSKKLMREDARRRLAMGLEKLQPADREVLVLRFLEELSVKDVAEIVGISQGAVKTRCFRAIERLHALLEGDSADSNSEH